MLDLAIDCYESIYKTRPNDWGIRSRLANYQYQHVVLTSKKLGKLDEAVARLRESIRLKPDFAEACVLLGIVLHKQNKLAEANLVFHDAMMLKPGWAGAYLNFGNLLRDQGNLDEAFVAYRDAMRLYNSEISKNTSLLEEVSAGDQYNGACAALLMATVKPLEGNRLDDVERARLLHQALVWLRDDLSHREKLAANAEPAQLPRFVQRLVHWQQDPDLATLRDDQQVQQLPIEDQEICRKLWADHAELLKSLQARLPAAGK